MIIELHVEFTFKPIFLFLSFVALGIEPKTFALSCVMSPSFIFRQGLAELLNCPGWP